MTGLAREPDPTILPGEGSHWNGFTRMPCIKEDPFMLRAYTENLTLATLRPALAQVPDVPRHQLGQPRQVAGCPGCS